MSERQQKPSALPPGMLTTLLQTVRRRKQSGDTVGARVLLHALVAQQPDDPRIWLALAMVAETRAEQRQALERAIALDPQNELASRGLERFRTADEGRPSTRSAIGAEAGQAPILTAPAETLALAPAPALLPTPDDSTIRIRWPLYLVIGVAVLIVLVAAVAIQSTISPAAEAPRPRLPGALPVPLITPASSPSATAVAAARPSPVLRAAPTVARPPARLTPLPPTPQPTPRPTLAPGDVISRGAWHASLLRPDYAVPLDGAIGTLQPRGRFILALVDIGNDGTAPARIPANLFSIQAGDGHRYLPVPAASTAYLEAYGHGQRGDLSMEEQIPPGGNVSVPLIFDVPPAARELMLRVGDEPRGWMVGDAPPAPPTPAPTSTP
ncbi:MAG TPA: DUF4352 domain-containing protein [Roseiflexaceae bacterium]